MNFGLAVFWSTFVLMHSFGEKKNKIIFFLEKKFLKCNFQCNFSANGYKQIYPTENTLTTEISVESEFYDFFLKKMHFTRNLKIMKSINLKLIYVLLIILA